MGAREYDIVVVGAGTAGANAAYQFARRGRRVALLERRPADAAGAQWHNSVLDRHFVQAGLDSPSGPERVAEGGSARIRGRDPGIGPTVVPTPTVIVDMALLGQRLRKLAVDSGVELLDEVQAVGAGVDERTGRIRSVAVRRDGDRSPLTFTASLFVDATGRTGVLRRQVDDLARWCPAVGGDELCTASDARHDVADTGGAEGFLERHGARPGDSVSFVGVNGGFSTASLTVSRDLTQVRVLVGCLANGRYGSAAQMTVDLCEREAWIGAAAHSGSGIIPLRRPYARITAAGIALVGDAACQVFPAHGSGIGIGLVAATMLADAVAAADDPGDAALLWSRYQAPFHRGFGGDLCGYDMLRRTSTRLGSSGVDALVRSGLLDEASATAGLEQRWANPSFTLAVRSAWRLTRNPHLAAVMVPALVRAQAVRLHAGGYPDHVDLDALSRWERGAATLIGGLPR